MTIKRPFSSRPRLTGPTSTIPEAAREDTRLTTLAIARTREGDTSALHFLYVKFAEDVHRYIYSIVRDHHDAEDLTQSVFLKLMTGIRSYEQRDVPFAAWLRRVARNAALDGLRAKRAIPSEHILVKEEADDSSFFERRECIVSALAQMPHDQREVLVLRYVAGLQPREIAEVLDKTDSSIHGLQHRGRRALKAALQALDMAPSTA